MLSRIFEGILTVIVDGIASGLSNDFIDHVKSQLTYEISLIQQMGVKYEMNLLFDKGSILGLLRKLCEIFWENLEYRRKQEAGEVDKEEYRKDAESYLDKIKIVLEFYADDECMNSFAENNKGLVKEILSDKTVSNSSDFVIFLHNVVEADLADESEIEGETAKQRQRRVKKERYGSLTKINKFSISHIEWLEEQMPELL